MNMTSGLYPLRFEPIYKAKVWGGRSFESLGRALPIGKAIGESWEVADLATTSVSGGGGSAEYSVVANGPLQGRSIRQLMEQFGEALLGPHAKPADDGGFPLLIKFLDANENLSVQVHPSPEYAATHDDAHLKSEAWYVIDAKPGAVIYKGLKPGTTPKQLREAIQSNSDEAVVPLLHAIEVRTGDCHYLPSGTLHALGAGVLVAEVQTPSDTTYRVYDWGRTERELHIEQAMACIDFTGAEHHNSQTSTSRDGFSIRTKATCDFFTIEELIAEGPAHLDFTPRSAEVWMAIHSESDARFDLANSKSCFDLAQGQTTLVPYVIGPTRFSTTGAGRWLRVTLPE